jgi:hypothetical protein
MMRAITWLLRAGLILFMFSGCACYRLIEQPNTFQANQCANAVVDAAIQTAIQAAR